MKIFVLPLLLAFVPFAAHAHHEADAAPAAEAETAAAPVTDATPVAAPVAVTEADPASEAVAASDQKSCIRETGTRIPARDEDGCTGHAGDSYDREDIDRSGAVDTADAIRKLSPSATIRH